MNSTIKGEKIPYFYVHWWIYQRSWRGPKSPEDWMKLVVSNRLRKLPINNLHYSIRKVFFRHFVGASTWWLVLSKQIEDNVGRCGICEKERKYLRTTKSHKITRIHVAEMMNVSLWIQGTHFSPDHQLFFQVDLNSPSRDNHFSLSIRKLKINGTQEMIMTDSGLQFSSREFMNFANVFDFLHLKSSRHHPQGNEKAERTKTCRKTSRPIIIIIIMSCW